MSEIRKGFVEGCLADDVPNENAYLYRQVRLYFRLQLPSATFVAEYIHLVALAASTQSAQFVIIHFAVS